MKTKKLFIQLLKYIYLIFLSIFVLLPIYYLIITTFKSSKEASIHPMALPEKLDFTHYIQAFQKMNYPQAFFNTFIITAFSVIGIIFIASMCGYVLYRKRKYKTMDVLFLIFLSGMMFPYQMSILGLYKVVQNLHLMNTHLGLILINISTNLPFAIFMMRSFVSTIPEELEEAAKIDGCSTLRIFFTITFPLMKPAIITVAILNTLTIWNNFIGPLYFLQSRNKHVILQEVYRNIGQFSTDWTSLFPMMVLGILPLLIFYIFMQKFIISGVMNGAVKG